MLESWPLFSAAPSSQPWLRLLGAVFINLFYQLPLKRSGSRLPAPALAPPKKQWLLGAAFINFFYPLLLRLPLKRPEYRFRLSNTVHLVELESFGGLKQIHLLCFTKMNLQLAKKRLGLYHISMFRKCCVF